MFPSTWAVGKQDFSHSAGETKTIVSSWDVRTLFASVTKYDKFKLILTLWFWRGTTNLSVQGQEAKSGALPLCSFRRALNSFFTKHQATEVRMFAELEAPYDLIRWELAGTEELPCMEDKEKLLLR